MNRKPILVSFWGGPGSGKSTWAMWLAHKLKNNGFKAEYVSEMAKDWAWDKSPKFKQPTAPWTLIGGQMAKLLRPSAQCDIIVTDSCPYMASMYIEDVIKAKELLKDSVVLAHANGYWTFKQMFDIFLDRTGHEWKQYGRNHTHEEAQALDKRQLETYLNELQHDEMRNLCQLFHETHGYTTPLRMNDVCEHVYAFVVRQLTDDSGLGAGE